MSARQDANADLPIWAQASILALVILGMICGAGFLGQIFQ